MGLTYEYAAVFVLVLVRIKIFNTRTSSQFNEKNYKLFRFDVRIFTYLFIYLYADLHT